MTSDIPPFGRPFSGVLALTFAALLTGCAPTLKLGSADVRLPDRFEAAGFERLDVLELDAWWRGLDDPQLEVLVAAALATSPTADLALARLREARAVRRGALANYGLQGDLRGDASVQQVDLLDGTTTAGPTGQVGRTQTVSPAFDLSWEVDLFGRASTARRAADQDLAAARFLFEGSRAALVADVADSLFSARGLAVQLEDAERSIVIQEELTRVLRIRADRGLAPTSDFARASADLGVARARAAKLAGDLHAAKRSVLVLIGDVLAPTASLIITPDFDLPPAAPTSLPGDLLRRRADVREAEARFAAASSRVKLQRLALFPRFTLTPGVGLTARSGAADATLATWTLGANVLLPVLDRPRLLAALDAETARAEQALATYEQTVQTAFSEADRALVGLEADRRRVALLTTAEAQAAKAHDAARERYVRGLGDLTTALDAERSWRATRSDLATARTDALRRTVTVYRALGGGWTAPLVKMDETR